jgi:ABC-2 type transport system ATP-binding protein
MNCAIQVSNLRKSYGSNAVLKGINLHIKEGEIFALLGVNGAGKTTALECIEGLKKYESGEISVNGEMGTILLFACTDKIHGSSQTVFQMEESKYRL